MPIKPALEVVDFFDEEGRPVDGLYSMHVHYSDLDPSEEVLIRNAATIPNLDYVFIRRFSDGRSSVAAAYVIDNQDERLTTAELASAHKEAWWHGSAPLLYVSWPTHIDVLSCARQPDFWGKKTGQYEYNPAETIAAGDLEIGSNLTTSVDVSAALEKRRRFSADTLITGTFWDDPHNAHLACAEKAAHRRLVQAIIELDTDIDGPNNPALRRLLLILVMIKYLEDKDVFPEKWFAQFCPGAQTFLDVLKGGQPSQLLGLLLVLEKKFNGDVFALSPDSKAISHEQLAKFASFIESRTLGQQLHLWEAYSFRNLPVEVLSSIYQHFANRGEGAIYTPPHLAALLLDYALPYRSLRGDEKVLDPTCGSGIFLVGAFRRLITAWRRDNQWAEPDVSVLKKILRECIFGVDIQSEALHLAAFSLALAICDALKPNVIWNELHFDSLYGQNLIHSDFFAFAPQNRQKFDVLVGNPPFMSAITEAGSKLNKDFESIRGGVPDNQAAYLIAEQGVECLRDGGRTCLIQPSGLFYNENARRFQGSLLRRWKIEHVLDFVSCRGLFADADTKIVALVARATKPNPEHRIVHLLFRRTFSVSEQLGFELDHYDRVSIRLEHALTSAGCWKVNLLGGGRLHHLLYRMQKMGRLKAFVKQKKWDFGEGFIAAKSGSRSKAKWLTGKPYLPTRGLGPNGINRRLISKVDVTEFRSHYTKKRYQAPLILIHANQNMDSAFVEEGFLAYRAKIVGIHAPKGQREDLRCFHKDFLNRLPQLKAFALIESPQLLVGKATALLKRDIDNLPWPKDGEAWNLSKWEVQLCSDVNIYMADYVRLGQDSALLRDDADGEMLKAYADAYVELLGSVYSNLQVGECIHLGGFICQTFHFGKRPPARWTTLSEENVKKLVYANQGEALRTTRMVRYYDDNVIVQIKPRKMRYWIVSAALRDADETLVDLVRQGY